MKRFIRILNVLAVGAVLANCAQERGMAGTSDQPSPRRDRNSQIAHQQLLEKAKKGRIDVYFVGDSITRRWGATDYPELLANWNSNFFGWNAGNFGWGADGIQNILWRLKNGELDGVNPKIIVVLAGINNVGTQPGDDAKVADITRGLRAIVNVCHKKAPKATIILTGIFPRNDGVRSSSSPAGPDFVRGELGGEGQPHLAVIPTINKINENLARLADGKRVRYLNVNDKLADKDGKLFEGMSKDKLHPTVKGYQVWADGLKPIFTEVLGPRAKIDHAPAPTGDPSVHASNVRARAGGERP